MDDETIEELPFPDDPIDTVPDNLALDVGDDTVVTSAAPMSPEHDDAPWSDHAVRGAVFFTSGIA